MGPSVEESRTVTLITKQKQKQNNSDTHTHKKAPTQQIFNTSLSVFEHVEYSFPKGDSRM